jgi:hypothetical protein
MQYRETPFQAPVDTLYTDRIPEGYAVTLGELLSSAPSHLRGRLPSVEEVAQGRCYFVVNADATTPHMAYTANDVILELYSFVPQAHGLTVPWRNQLLQEALYLNPSKAIRWTSGIYVVGCHRIPDPVSGFRFISTCIDAYAQIGYHCGDKRSASIAASYEHGLLSASEWCHVHLTCNMHRCLRWNRSIPSPLQGRT